MPGAFNFKLDPSSLPRLDSKGENYLDWRAAWNRAFRFANLGEIVTGVRARPAEGDELAAWQHSDDQAFVMLLSAIHSDLMTYITSCESSAAA
jgi:hypothetical protein